MAGITQIVDERIEQIRRERAELDQLRITLEQREAELLHREHEQEEGLAPLSERKASLLKEIEEAEARAERLRAERNASIESFGGEMNRVNAEKNAEKTAQAKHLQNEINFLLKNKTDLSEEIEALRQELAETEEKASRERNRIIEEKENILTRLRAERETSLNEINLAHSVTVAELDSEKKAVENEIAALEQTKNIEWNKVQTEISRYKTARLAEADAQREQLLAEAEKERAALIAEHRNEERKQISSISQIRRDWEKEYLNLQTRKQAMLDEIKLLEYEYEKAKSENIVRLEKARVDEQKAIDAERAEAIIKTEEEQAVILTELRKQGTDLRIRNREAAAAAEKMLADYETKKAAVLKEIDLLSVKYDQQRAENEAALEAIKSQKLQEIDEKRLEKIKEVEELRQKQISELEQSYFERLNTLEESRSEKLEAFRESLSAAEGEMDALKQKRYELERELEVLRAECVKTREEIKTLQKTALLERQAELEKLANEKLAEIEIITASRIASADERYKRLSEESQQLEEQNAARTIAAGEEIASLRREIANLESDLARQKEERMTEIQKETIDAMDELSKLKLAKLGEIEAELEKFKNERLNNIQNDLDRQVRANYKKLDELAALNDDYNKRMKELQELSLTLEADKRNIYLKEQRCQDEVSELKAAMQAEKEAHTREMALIADAKDQQIIMLQNQIKNYGDLEVRLHEMAMRLEESEVI